MCVCVCVCGRVCTSPIFRHDRRTATKFGKRMWIDLGRVQTLKKKTHPRDEFEGVNLPPTPGEIRGQHSKVTKHHVLKSVLGMQLS